MNLPNSICVRVAPPLADVVGSGELDLATTPELTAQLNDAITAGCRDLRVDLGGVTFIDASTVGVLVGFDRRLRELGGSLTIVEAAACVRRILGLVGLSRMLDSDGSDESRRVV